MARRTCVKSHRTNPNKMKTFAVGFVALFAVAVAGPIIDYTDSVGAKVELVEGYIEDGDDKIVGGTNTTIENHPYQLSLRQERRGHVCGGAIITATRGLTAAHCTGNPAFFSIQAGSTNVNGDANAQIRNLSRIVNHPLASIIAFDHDIAILFWEQPLTFGATVQPIALPAANATVPYGENATASGWGATSHPNGSSPLILQSISQPLISNEQCNISYPGRMTADMVCAGGEAGRGACYGDSGGPLVHSNLLIGLVSWSRPCGLEGYPTGYARVAYFIDWISENINSTDFI